ncbi:MAG: methyl-accepting chemotaxis protein [Myxococcota bacterium]
MRAAIRSENDFRRAVLAIDLGVGMGALAVMVFYLAMLLDLGAGEWRDFAAALAVISVLAGAGLEPVRRRLHAPIRTYLRTPPDARERALVESAFAAIMRLPQTMLRLTLVSWAACGAATCVAMVVLGHPSWLFGQRFWGIVVSATAGGLISMGFVYFLTKRAFEPLCAEIARGVPDPERRRELVRPVRIARKLQFVVAGSGVASLVFAMGVAYEGAVRALVDEALSDRARAIEALVPNAGAGDLDAAIARTWPVAGTAPEATRFELLAPSALATSFGLDAGAFDERASGTALSDDGERLVAWSRLADGRLLVASAEASTARRALVGLRPLLAVVLVTAVALSLGITWMLAEDVRRTVDVLAADADRLASGDLASATCVESEDELGDLARAFARMGASLRATVARVAEAADRVESAASEISRTGASVAEANAEQVRRISEAGQLMERIRDEVGGVATSAQQLGYSVEESSSSILELGAAGHELSETAGALSQRVDEVSSSIEQMVRSVKQVGATAEGLSQAASETSSSMEEMASAMRAVDTTAAKTGDLAADVVQSSESGVEKVRQTIEGMHAIRDATDAAENVIRALGRRTDEIGAILDVIDDVGAETTLLALNAAIIAAQAGENGRAFSVVADEIKELADRVLVSTKEIADVVRAVQLEASNAVGAVEAGSASVALGVDVAAEAGVSLEQIARAARESGQHIARIVAAVREQTAAAAHVAALMDRVNGGVEEIRSAGEDQDRGNEVVFRSAVTMREIALQVRRTTEEQSRGFARIRETTEGVRGAVESINASLRQQSEACTQIASFLEQVEDRTRENDRSVQHMGEAMNGLAREAEALRAEVARFRI